jgi:hypothetical protein
MLTHTNTPPPHHHPNYTGYKSLTSPRTNIEIKDAAGARLAPNAQLWDRAVKYRKDKTCEWEEAEQRWQARQEQ